MLRRYRSLPAAGIQDALHPSEHGILECRLACQSASTLQRFVQALVEPIGIEPRVAKVGRPMQQMDHQMVLRFEALLGPHALQVRPVGFEARLASIDRQDPIMLVPNGDQLLQTLSGQQQANPTIAKSRCVFATFRNQKKEQAQGLGPFGLTLRFIPSANHFLGVMSEM